MGTKLPTPHSPASAPQPPPLPSPHTLPIFQPQISMERMWAWAFSQIQSSVIVELIAGFVSRGPGHVEVPAQVHPSSPWLASLHWTATTATQRLAGCHRAALQSTAAAPCSALPWLWSSAQSPPFPPPPCPINRQQQQHLSTHTTSHAKQSVIPGIYSAKQCP